MLPPGLTLDAGTGVISGIPTATGTFNLTVQLRDGNNTTSTSSLGITIPALAMVTTTLPDAYRTSVYNQTLAATGGKTPYSWTRTSGSLPAGLVLNGATGVISGTPTTQAVTRSFTIQVRDAANAIQSRQLTIAVYTLPSISTSSLPNGTLNVAYSRTLAVSGGKASFTWSVSSGLLPTGLTLNPATGVISGVPATRGSFPFTARVVDSNGRVATRSLSIRIN
jgi:hypothetical protein